MHPVVVHGFCLWALVGAGCSAIADRHVAITSTAGADYTARKFHDGKPQRESYVFMAGRFFDGQTVDHSLDRMTFRQLAASVAVDLAKDEYYPARDVKSADLLIVVHWGVTTPKLSMDEIRGRVSYSADTSDAKTLESLRAAPDDGVAQLFAAAGSESDRERENEISYRETDALDTDYFNASNAKLLGYGRHLRKLNQDVYSSPDEIALRSDLASERYFVILRAYDLRQITNGKPRPVWTLHMNMRSPGHNFNEAVSFMGTAAVNFFGRQTDKVETLQPKVRQGTVTIGDITIIGEAKEIEPPTK